MEDKLTIFSDKLFANVSILSLLLNVVRQSTYDSLLRYYRVKQKVSLNP